MKPYYLRWPTPQVRKVEIIFKVKMHNMCFPPDYLLLRLLPKKRGLAKVRAEKAEDVLSELTAKARQLDTEVDLCTEKLGIVLLQLKEKEKSKLAVEAKMNALTRESPVLRRTWGRLKGRRCRPPRTTTDDMERAKKVGRGSSNLN